MVATVNLGTQLDLVLIVAPSLLPNSLAGTQLSNQSIDYLCNLIDNQ